MKEMNSLEMQLRSWELRRPSETVRRNLFGARRSHAGFVVAFRWMAPAAACAFLAAALVNQETGMTTGSASGDPQFAMTQSNQNLIPGLMTGATRSGSNFAAVGFDSTNRSDAGSRTGSFFPGR